jgi:hypothetical protein
MWLVVARTPAPDASYWRGRCWLAAVDAVAWPLVWVLALRQIPVGAGSVGSVLVLLAVLAMIGRLRRALRVNHRYRFTTWRWGRVVVVLLFAGAMLKLAMLA